MIDFRKHGRLAIALGALALVVLGVGAVNSGLGPRWALAAPDDEPAKNENDNADGTPGGPTTGTPDGVAPEPRKLTDTEINRIRFMELRAMRGLKGVDPVTVKISRDVLNDFLVEMTGHDDFKGKKARQNFLKRTPPQKLHMMAHYTGPKFADKVEILTDPEIFVEFRKHVMPQVIRGCSTNGCHNSTNEKAYGFKLFKDPKKAPGTTYANYITLNDYMLDGKRMINRNDPSRSLLVTYMLPASEVPAEFRHPGDVEIRPLFQSHKHRRFQRILQWIGSLKIPPEDYGVRLIPMPEMPEDGPTPADGDKTSPDDDSKDRAKP
ncbi:MAG TPA: hypothetical protein P5081_07690 [Phycisphaerae bacterium]|nr:hypothetical protein [Phycisphaerae bacterium]HRW52753.1 hypothetical protein [Phycisphaerae bacterium]